MSERRTHSMRRTSRWIACLGLPVALGGCSAPTSPPPPPDGGARLELRFELFAASVEPVLQRHGCDAGGDCHGGGIRGSLALSPASAKDVRFDFEQVALQVSPTAHASSAILTEPLALEAGGTPHAVKPFASVSDSGYLQILEWIEDGAR